MRYRLCKDLFVIINKSAILYRFAQLYPIYKKDRVLAMHLELWQCALGALGAFLVGLSKTGIPGLGILNVAIFALVFPARESVGLVLVILICGDLVAVTSYR